MPRFTSFVMFAEMRTGSNFLEANLNALPGVLCHGEAFNPHFIGKQDNPSLFGIDMAARDADPLAFLARLRAETDGLAGFRLFHDHDARVIDAVLADPACAKIILTRNPVESYVSLKIAQDTGQWRLTNASKLKTARVEFEADEFERHLRELQAFQVILMNRLQTSGQTAFYIDYEDLNDLAVLNGLAAFLGVAARLEALDPRLKKQNPEDIAEKVLNPAAMEQALARLDRFNLSRSPNFEPRRPAAIPSFLASDAGALFLPVKGGPEAEVEAWLAALGAPLAGRFVQKTLRQWKRAHPGHRSFAVIRHPLPRAWVGYLRVLRGQDDAGLRRLLVKSYQLPLPEAEAGPEALRAGFLAFLRWLKPYLAGQTGQKIDAHLASQTAILQGFAQFQVPDLVLREDRLAAGLAFLAAELGIAAAEFRPVPADPQLAALCDDEIEDACRDAYQRDCMGFGFGRWRG